MSERRLDLRGMRCPWPALRVSRALREAGDAVLALADDPRAPEEIAAVAEAQGWRIEAMPAGAGVALRLTRNAKGCEAPGNAPFTVAPA